MTHKIEIPWHGPVAGAIADAVTEQLLEQDTQSLVQGVDADALEGELHAMVGSLETDAVFATAFEALCKHRPEDVPDPAETEVVGVDVQVEEPCYVAVEDNLDEVHASAAPETDQPTEIVSVDEVADEELQRVANTPGGDA